MKVSFVLLAHEAPEQLKDLVSEVTNAVEKTTGADKNAFHVVIEEMKAAHYGVAGVRKADQ